MHRRPRRLRQNENIRALVQENQLSANDFLVPIFIVEGENIKEEIASMPNYYRFSLDTLEEELKELAALKLFHLLLFTKTEEKRKDNQGKEALNPDGLMQRSLKKSSNSIQNS